MRIVMRINKKRASGMVRMNITLPDKIYRRLDLIAGPRGRSRFIAEAVEKKIGEMHRENFQKLLEEGYAAAKREVGAVAREYEAADLEGWDEY